MTTTFRMIADTGTHIVQAECETDYALDGDAVLEADRFYPVGGFRFYEVQVTDKATGLTEDWGDEVPEGMLAWALESADEQFKIE